MGFESDFLAIKTLLTKEIFNLLSPILFLGLIKSGEIIVNKGKLCEVKAGVKMDGLGSRHQLS